MELLIRPVRVEDAVALVDILNPIIETGKYTVLDTPFSVEDEREYLAGFPKPVHFPYLLDPNLTVHKAYTQRDMPTILIIDSKGILRARSPSVGADQLVPYLQKLL